MDRDREYNFAKDADGISKFEKEELQENPWNSSFCQYVLQSTDSIRVNNRLKKSEIFKDHDPVR